MLRIRLSLPILLLSAVSLSVQAGLTPLRFVEPERKSPYRGAKNVPQIVEAFYAAERSLWEGGTTSLEEISSLPAGEREDFQTFNAVLELSRQAFIRIAQHTGLQVLMGVSGSGSQVSYSLVLNNKWYAKRVAHFDTALQAAANAQAIVEGYSARVASDPTDVATSDLQTQSASLSQVYDTRIQDLDAQKRDLEAAWDRLQSEKTYGTGKLRYPYMDIGALFPVGYMPIGDFTALREVREKLHVLQSYWETLFSGSFTLFNKPLMVAPATEAPGAAAVVILGGTTSAPASASSTPLSSPRFGDQPSAVEAGSSSVVAGDAPQLDVVDEIPAGAEADSTVSESSSSSSSPAPVAEPVVADDSLVAAQPTLPVDAESEDDEESFSDTASTVSEEGETPEDAALPQPAAETPATPESADEGASNAVDE